jgi:hypothetical protein
MDPLAKFAAAKIKELKQQIKDFDGDKGTLEYAMLKQDLRAAEDFLRSFKIENGK